MDSVFLFSNDTIFKRSTWLYSMENVLYYFPLKEKKIFTIIDNLNLDSLLICKDSYYDSGYYYYISLLKFNTRKDIILYKETKCKRVEVLIDVFRQIENKYTFNIIRAEIEGLDSLFLGRWINNKSVSLKMNEYDAFLLMKKFIQLKATSISEIDNVDFSKYKNEITTMYLLNHKGIKINKILFNSSDLVLIYSNEKKYLIKNFVMPFDVKAYE